MTQQAGLTGPEQRPKTNEIVWEIAWSFSAHSRSLRPASPGRSRDVRFTPNEPTSSARLVTSVKCREETHAPQEIAFNEVDPLTHKILGDHLRESFTLTTLKTAFWKPTFPSAVLMK
jgi:hypothetical protein